AKLGDLDLSKAKGIDLTPTVAKGKVGAAMKELERVARLSDVLEMEARLDFKGGSYAILQLAGRKIGGVFHYSSGHSFCREDGRSKGEPGLASDYGASFSDCILFVANHYPKGTLLLDSVKVKSTKAPVKGKELKTLATAAWCEACGVDVP